MRDPQFILIVSGLIKSTVHQGIQKYVLFFFFFFDFIEFPKDRL